MTRFTIGLDFGTNSCRAVVLDLDRGSQVGTSTFAYPSGDLGVLSDPRDPNVARQHPGDYLQGAEATIRGALATAGLDPREVVGIGVDATGSTPLPVDRRCRALAEEPRWREDLAAQAWLWKDHSSHGEAEEITARARAVRPEYLAGCGGVYSSEWFWAKALRLCRVAPEVFAAMDSFVELCDFVPAVLAGVDRPEDIRRSLCAAGHKAMFDPAWGGLPDEEFLAELHPGLAELRGRLYREAFPADRPAGVLCEEWAERLGLSAGVTIAVGAFDAHMGAVSAGVGPGVLVKILGTSTCDVTVAPLPKAGGPALAVPGICGIVPGSVLPDLYGIEAGQSAVGDIFQWFARYHTDGVGGEDLDRRFATLEAEAARQAPGAHGLVGLDWHNGNRTVLVDPLLSGLLVGQSLATRPADIYRAWIEATAFGALKIIERLEDCGVPVRDVVTCGGLSFKSSLLMQIYADVTGRRMKVSAIAETCAIGAALFAAAAAGIAPVADLQVRVVRHEEEVYHPDPDSHQVYRRLYGLYTELHDAFGHREGALGRVMKELLDLRAQARMGEATQAERGR